MISVVITWIVSLCEIILSPLMKNTKWPFPLFMNNVIPILLSVYDQFRAVTVLYVVSVVAQLFG